MPDTQNDLRRLVVEVSPDLADRLESLRYEGPYRSTRSAVLRAALTLGAAELVRFIAQASDVERVDVAFAPAVRVSK